MFVEATNAAAFAIIDNTNLVGFSLDDMLNDLRAAQEAAKAALISGELEYGEAARKFQEDVNTILDNYGVMDDYTRILFASIIEIAIASWAELTGVTIDAVGTIVTEVEKTGEVLEETIEIVEELAKVFRTFELDEAIATFNELSEQLDNSAEGSLDYIVVVGKLRKAYATLITAAEAVAEQDKEVGAGLEKLIADYELLGLVLTDVVIPKTKEASTIYQDIVSSALVDITWDIVTFHRSTERSEEEHWRKVEDITQTSLDRLKGIKKNDQERREDTQTAYNRKLEDIEIWYWQRVEDGAANTAEKKIILEAEKQEKLEAALLNHTRRLEDLDTTYTRNIEDNEADREQALQDELEAYEEQRPKITEIVKQSFLDMVDAIVESKIKETIEGIIAQFLGLGVAAETGVAAANAALAGLNPLAMALVPLWLGSTAGGATFVQDLNKWLTDQIYGAGTYEAGRGGTVRVQSYAGGGVVPGPTGVPVPAIVHGGEPIGTAGFAQVLDYEMMGRAVQAGTYEAMVEVLSKDAGRPIIVQMPDGTKIAQALYNPLAAEKSRRGG